MAPAFSERFGRRQRVFCASLADVFDNQVDRTWRDDLFELIGVCTELDWLLLTKRPQNVRKMLPSDWGDDGYPNVWIGMTAEDQARFDQRWKHLAATAAAVRFVSYEPAIGPLQLGAARPDWLITGGESGPGARSLRPQWIRDAAAECDRARIAVFHKQWGAYRNNPLVAETGLSIEEAKRRDPHGKGGALLDGCLRREIPVPRGRIRVAA